MKLEEQYYSFFFIPLFPRNKYSKYYIAKVKYYCTFWKTQHQKKIIFQLQIIQKSTQNETIINNFQKIT